MANPEHVEILLQGSKIWNKWREENHKVIPDLRWANLYEANRPVANLYKANLEMADLRNAYLEEANLERANLEEANLTGVRIAGANLEEANLQMANLTGAHIAGANLTGTNFSAANLTDAYLAEATLILSNFSGASLQRTDFSDIEAESIQFSDVNLSTAKGLELVHHRGPSTIGIDTLIRSKGKIPEVFLRGCGIPEDFITYLPSLMAKPLEFYSCFISYSHADKAFARQLHDFLQGRGIRCWLDEHQLLPGHDIFEEVDRGIKLWDKVLLCASKDSLSSWWVDNEINRAFKKEQTIMKSRGKKVLALIPLDLDSFIFREWENGKAEQVKSRLAADFQGWQNDNDKLQQQFELVLKALRTDGGREAPPVSRL